MRGTLLVLYVYTLCEDSFTYRCKYVVDVLYARVTPYTGVDQ